MSINSMANAAAARRVDIGVPGRAPKGFTEIAMASRTTPASASAHDGGAGSASSTADTAYNLLFGYIPTEILTLFVAVLAALNTGGVDKAADDDVFIGFLVATPIVVWLVYAAKVMAAGKPVPWRLGQWPMWEMFAATVAYTAWAIAMPAASFDTGWHARFEPLSSVLVLISAAVLGLLAPLFQNNLSGSEGGKAPRPAVANGAR